jgi:hypothetical protein
MRTARRRRAELNVCADTLDALAHAADSYGPEKYGPVTGNAVRLVRDLLQGRLGEIRAAFREAPQVARDIPVMACRCGEVSR